MDALRLGPDDDVAEVTAAQVRRVVTGLIEGAQIRLTVDHLPGGQDPLPVWLWSSKTGMTSEDVDLRWQAFLRRF